MTLRLAIVGVGDVAQRDYLPEEFDRAVLLGSAGRERAFLPRILTIRDPFGEELPVDRICADLALVQPGPDLREADVVLATAQRAWPVAGGERGRLVEEEQLGELAGLAQRAAQPAL